MLPPRLLRVYSLVASLLTAAYSASPLPPDLSALASAWQPVDTLVYGAPSVTNSWGSLLASTIDVLAFNSLTIPPLSQGWNAPFDAARLIFTDATNGTAPNGTRWTPYSLQRQATTTVLGNTSLAINTELRMGFEAGMVMLIANITTVGVASGQKVTFRVAVDFALPVRYYPRADECPSWHYPTNSYPCCWNWFPPMPSANSTGRDFVYRWDRNAMLQGVDAASPAVNVWGMPPLRTVDGTLWLGPPDFGRAGSRGTWSATLCPAGCPGIPSSVVIAAVVAVNTSLQAATEAVRASVDLFDTAWDRARTDWQQRFDDAFAPGNGHYTGHLPLLLDESGIDNTTGRISSALTPMARTYYLGVASLQALERTNLPPPSWPAGGGYTNETCSTSVTADLRESPTQMGWDELLRWRADTFGAVPGMGPSRAAASPAKLFTTGGGLNATTNIFYWDNSYAPLALALLDPDYISSQFKLWASSVDETGIPSYWGYWGYEYLAGRGIGNYYAANDMTLFTMLAGYLAITGDVGFLANTIPVSYPNGTVINTTVYDVASALAAHWRDLNVSDYLADYGGAPNLLECVPTYIHRVAGFNAANAWMMNNFAYLSIASGKASEDDALIQRLRDDADSVAAAVLNALYVPASDSETGGYFAAQYLNGTLQPVRHVIDFVYVTLHLGVQRSGNNSSGPPYIPQSIGGAMCDFLDRELRTPLWMRALSLNDSAAPYSNRSDHGPSGAYIGWPTLSMRALAANGRYTEALAFLNATNFVATLGPYGQAVEVRPPGLPYKPMDVTLYNEMAGFSFPDAIIQAFFGFQPPLPGAPPRPGNTPLVDADVPRGLDGSLLGVRWGSQLIDIVSNASGLFVRPSARRYR